MFNSCQVHGAPFFLSRLHTRPQTPRGGGLFPNRSMQAGKLAMTGYGRRLSQTCNASEHGLPLAVLLGKQQHSSLGQLQPVPDLQTSLAPVNTVGVGAYEVGVRHTKEEKGAIWVGQLVRHELWSLGKGYARLNPCISGIQCGPFFVLHVYGYGSFQGGKGSQWLPSEEIWAPCQSYI